MKYEEITSKIIAASFNVHKKLGTGFQELIYHRALYIELLTQKLSFESEKEMVIYYDKQPIGTRRVDFLVEGNVLVEIKAYTKLESVHLTQAINYLKVYNIEICLLINFGAESLQVKRLLNKHFYLLK